MTQKQALANSQPEHTVFAGNHISRLREKGLSHLESDLMRSQNAHGLIIGMDRNIVIHAVKIHRFRYVKSRNLKSDRKSTLQLENDAVITIGSINDCTLLLTGTYRYIYFDKIEEIKKEVWEHVYSRLERTREDRHIYASCYAEDLEELPMWVYRLIEGQKNAR